MSSTTQPTADLQFEITLMERAHQDGAYSHFLEREIFPARDGFDARVTVTSGGREVGELHLDRIDGETAWHVSARFTAGCSMPAFMHGLFSRCTIPTVAADELAALLDAAAAEVQS